MFTNKTHNMKKYLKTTLALLAILLVSTSGKAQFYQIANQLPGLIQPALSGSFNYKGYIDASYLGGVGNHKVDIVNISTSQGFRYSNWFYMGVGLGVDIAMSHTSDQFDQGPVSPGFSNYYNRGYTKTGVMVPVFTDFRFNVGNEKSASFYADIRLGASFLMTDKYLAVDDGFITNRQYFYLKPSIGVRVPISKNNPKQAVNVGVTYQLLTSDYWYYYPGNITLNALGATVGFEW